MRREKAGGRGQEPERCDGEQLARKVSGGGAPLPDVVPVRRRLEPTQAGERPQRSGSSKGAIRYGTGTLIDTPAPFI